MRVLLVPLVAAAFALSFATTPAAAASINVCGTLQALNRPNPPQHEGAGSATIDGRTFRLSDALSTNNTNTIAPGAVVGARVCLSGELVGGTTDLVQNFVLTPASTPTLGSLPSTSTAPSAHAAVLLLIAASLVLTSTLRSKRLP